MQIIETRVHDDATVFPQYDRGLRFLDVLRQIGVDVRGRAVADLGTGFGSIAFAAARAGASWIIAVDAHPGRLAEVRNRAAKLGLHVEVEQANLLEPLTKLPKVDIAFLVGVVEYAGLWDSTLPARHLQRQVLANVRQILKPNGVLIFASKNRLWPPFARRDIHTGQPLVNVLPRSLADKLSMRLSGKLYREHIYSFRGWERLLAEAGFTSTKCYLPFFNYQYPLTLQSRPGVSTIGRLSQVEIPPELRRHAIGRLPILKAGLMIVSSAIGLPISQSVVIVASSGPGA